MLMRTLCALVVCVSLAAQTVPPGDPERIRELVEAGALPRKALERIQAAEEEANDEEILRGTLYGDLSIEDLTEEQGEAMLAAAGRQLARKQRLLAEAEERVESGVAPRSDLTPLLTEVDHGRKTLTLAVTRHNLLRELSDIVHAEQEFVAALEEGPDATRPLAERFDGHGLFHDQHLRTVVLSFEKQFGKPLPVSARGDTTMHRAMGFDHRGRVDVAVYPDSEEGVWLRRLLEDLGVPYFAFRGRVPGKATAAHIHIGPPSLRLRPTD
jgi:hypothetical protein